MGRTTDDNRLQHQGEPRAKDSLGIITPTANPQTERENTSFSRPSTTGTNSGEDDRAGQKREAGLATDPMNLAPNHGLKKRSVEKRHKRGLWRSQSSYL